jgi:hypothetical protein
VSWELKGVSRFLLYAAPVFIPWLLIGVLLGLLGSRTVLIALFPVSILWLGTGFFIDGYLEVRSLLRRKKYLSALISFIFYGFFVMIAPVSIYLMVKNWILGK